MARKTRVIPLLVLTVCPSVSWALGLGEIDLQSALNQPLRAEISIVGASGEELTGINAHLASRDAFDRLGLDRPQFLNSLEFEVGRNDRGEPVLKVSSMIPITEPFVTFLLEAKWARGSLLREYTVLLDPPTFVPQATPAPAPVVRTPSTATQTTRTSGTVLRQPEPTPVAETVAPARAPYTPPEGSYRIGRGDTLWEVAERYRPSGVTVNQMMIALYEANPEAFSGNINRLRAGSILRIPSAEDLRTVSGSAADSAVREHMESWKPGSGMLGPKIEPSLRLVPPSEPVARPSAGGTRDEEGDDADSYLRDEVDRLRRELESAEGRLQVQNDQVALLQKNLEEARASAGQVQQPAAELEPEAEAEAEAEPEAELAAPAEEAVPVEAEAEAEAPAEDAGIKERATRVVSAPAEKSTMDTLLGWLMSPISFVLLGALALLAALLVFLRLRKTDEGETAQPWEDVADEGLDEIEGIERTQTSVTLRAGERGTHPGFVVEEAAPHEDTANLEPDVFEAAGPGAGLDTTTVEPSVASGVGEFDLEDTLQIDTSKPAAEAEVTDPIAEADFHMAYGLYDQAAEILQTAVDNDPSNGELQMKLAEVFFVWGNADQFRGVAQTMSENRETVGQGNWEKILIMGKQLLPDDEMFGETPGTTGGTDMDLSIEDSQMNKALDLELFEEGAEGEGDEMVDLDFGGTMDFPGDTQEMPSVDDGSEITREIPVVEEGSPGDIDSTVETPIAAVDQTAEIDLDDLGLDVNLDDSFIGRLPEGDFSTEDILGDDFNEDFNEESLTAVLETGGLSDEDATMIAGPEDMSGLASIAADDSVDFDLGADLDATGTPDDVQDEATDTTTLSAGDLESEGDDMLAATTEMTALVDAH
ncbi:MAG: LysM peptidoglycan-binding domain-containing protein, partial [Chromatiales bacterium]|nr:LysM peptidoglycan-binding domain-containing protein [Chromatiales bacterium]